ncbi:MAG: hypothetical protein OXI40_09375 [Chloroflexota bacterium]|nr:hypothetical protein [Chloroflexota bacterium]
MAEPEFRQLQSELLRELRGSQLLAHPDIDAAFSQIPRHLFLPEFDLTTVYQDKAIALKVSPSGETLSSSSQPTMMAIMLQQLRLAPDMNVLEIGTASGYNAAILSRIVGAGGYTTTLEIDRELAEEARNNLLRAGFGKVLVVDCDAAGGYEPRAQYDRILATAGVWDVPRKWLQQLRADGRLVVPIWLDGVQVSAAFTPQPDGTYLSVDNRPCAFVYLQGLAAGPDVRKRVGGGYMEVIADDIDKIDTAALHLLLSEDVEIQRLGKVLRPEEFWYGLQLYLMMREPPRYVFAVYAIPEGELAYGMAGNGIMLFRPNSAVFAAYDDGGVVRCYGGAAAFLKLQALFDDWLSLQGPLVNRLSLQLIPLEMGEPLIETGKLFRRKDHYLHVWLD